MLKKIFLSLNHKIQIEVLSATVARVRDFKCIGVCLKVGLIPLGTLTNKGAGL